MEKFIIDSTKVKGRLSVLFDSLPTSWRTLVDLNIKELSDNQQQICGITETSWTDENQGLLFTKTSLCVLFDTRTKEVEILSIKAIQLLFQDFTVNWSVKDLESGTLLFQADELSNFPLAESNLSELYFLKGIESLAELAVFDQFTYELHLSGFVEPTLSHIWRSQSTPNIQFGGFFKVDQLSLTGTIGANAIYMNEKPSFWQEINLRAKVEIEKLQAQIELIWENSSNYRVRFSPTNESGFFEFTDLLSAFKLGHMTGALDEFKKDLAILDDIQISQVTAEFERKSLDLSRIVLYGNLIAFGANFEIRFTYSRIGRFQLSIRLRIGSFFSVNDLLGSFPGGKVKLPLDARVADLRINAQFNPLSYDVFINTIENWKFTLGSTPIELKALRLFIAKERDGFTFRMNGLITICELDIGLIATNTQGNDASSWFFETDIAQSTSIKLVNIITDLGQLFHFIVPDHIPDFEIHNIRVSFDTGSHDFGLELGVSLEKPGLGPFSEGEIWMQINLTKNDRGTHDFQMDFTGFISVAGTEFDARATNLGRKDWAIDFTWDAQGTDALDLTKIMQFFAGESFQPHQDFDTIKHHLLIEHAEFHYQHGVAAEGENPAVDTQFLMDLKVKVDETTVEGLFSGVKPAKEAEKWHFLVGIGYTHLSKVPKTIFDPKKLTDFHLENLWIIVHTSDESQGHWPPLPASIPSVLNQQATKPGLALLAEMDIAQHDVIPGAQKVFEGHEHTKVVVLAEINKSGLLLEGILEGDLTIPTGQGHGVLIKEVTLTIEIGSTPLLKLGGIFDLDLDDHRHSLKLTLEVDSAGITMAVHDKIDQGGWEPFGLKGVHIDDFGLELGIDFEPPAARIGFQGGMHLDKEDVDSDQLAIILAFSEPIPNPEYFAIAIKNIDFSKILNLFPGSSKDGHSHIAENLAKVTDFGLVWCEKPVVLPDGTNGRIGFSLHGAVTILNWGAYFSLEVHPDSGIQGIAEMAPIELGPLRITGKGPGVAIKQEWRENEWHNVSNVTVNGRKETSNQLLTDSPKTRMLQLVKPGGVEVQFNSAASPYLRMSASVQFFGMNLLDVDIDIEKDQAHFYLFVQIPLIAKFKVDSYVHKNSDFGFNGNFFLGLDINIYIPFPVEPIHIQIRIGFDVTLKIEKVGNEIDIYFDGGFYIMGRKFELGHFKLDGIPASLKDIPKWILAKIEGKHLPDFNKNMTDGSGENNDDAYSQERTRLANELLEHAKSWANFVHRDIEQLKNQERMSDTEIEKLIIQIDADTDQIKEKAKAHVDEIKGAGTSEHEHLQSLTELAQKPTRSSNDHREMEMDTMRWEIEWLRDEKRELRAKIQTIWNEHHADESMLNQEISALYFYDMKNKTGYPERAVKHHLNIIQIHHEAHVLEHHILQTGRSHSQAILNNVVNKRFDPLNTTKTT